jgi:hypothetical protein
MSSSDGKASIIIGGVLTGFLTFIGIEAAALLLAVIVKLVEQYTKWFYLGEDWNNWLGVVFLQWATLPAIFLGLVVGARKVKSRWNE